ncbi:phosphoribosylaminoimidazolesuccinocarboxamide synthase [Facklamia sp. DSM 111018]|uniref:phosphoribosylaminoimidazolesuccinocarboxamide synthase n=1 Tax=Facklamia lactis TaxID=2749967 RepID=A0ABS0LR57_9LACT|nr:phosphoribosylaminoimidazolesuccinocarboxamide synthase [Facklamia lactis]MBG9986517.1 phosphoribosylaminoimidazolesuccinocarboxamide synthase [Facklamia lactis]
MQLVKKGKTKDVYQLENGHYLLKFKDDVTGEDGKFDPGANSVGLSIEGVGRAGLEMSSYFFDQLNQANIATHFVKANLDEQTMEVKPAQVFGKGLEVICRLKAVGSFYRRYGEYIEEGADLPQFVEFTIKDDERQDPPINAEGLMILNILNDKQIEQIISLTRQITSLVAKDLAQHQLDLYDIKFEFGLLEGSEEVVLIDEISGGNMRVYQGDRYIEPLELHRILFSK